MEDKQEDRLVSQGGQLKFEKVGNDYQAAQKLNENLAKKRKKKYKK